MYVQVVLCVYERPEGKIACKMELSRGGFSFSLSKTDCIQFCCCGFEKPTEKLKPNYPCELNHSYFIFFKDIKSEKLFFLTFQKIFCMTNLRLLSNSILFAKLFWATVRKNWSSDREKLLRFEVDGRDLQTHWDY